MMYQEEEQSRVRRQSSRDAIALALQGQWKEAVAVNKSIIELFPNDVEALNRLGRAYMELVEYKGAEAAYRRTLEIDAYNSIAQKNIHRLAVLKKSKVTPQTATQKLEPQVFIEEIGKAGVVHLQKLAPPPVLARMAAGDIVNIKAKGNTLAVETPAGQYLGVVAPKYGQRLIRLITGGNRYSAAIVSSNEKAVTVIIREAFQHPDMAGQLSFPTRGVEGARTDITDRGLRRELEQEESLLGEPGYTVVGGEEAEVLPQERTEDEFEEDTES
ncbi:MAG: hypothetical protein Q8O43_10695 [Dehalococcoidia bacterium]|nr:hypothetical protein [Dehalococcoidia bacterium]